MDTGEYAIELPPEVADRFVTEQMQYHQDETVLDFIKSIKRFHKYQNHTKDTLYEWEYDHKDELSANSSGKNTIEYFKRHEMHSIYDASLGYGSVKSYHNRNMTDEERARISEHLSQRFEKPKTQIGPDDFKRANSWKIPSIIATCIDIGLRPIEVGRAKTSWVNTRDNEIIIPAKESTKNEEPWQCKISGTTARALNKWLDERKQYDKYRGTDTLWLTKYGNPYGNDSLNPLLDRLMEETDIQAHSRQLTWYSIRRGCATMWAERGGITDAQAQLRHCELSTTMDYASSPEKSEKNARMISGKDK